MSFLLIIDEFRCMIFHLQNEYKISRTKGGFPLKGAECMYISKEFYNICEPYQLVVAEYSLKNLKYYFINICKKLEDNVNGCILIFYCFINLHILV